MCAVVVCAAHTSAPVRPCSNTTRLKLLPSKTSFKYEDVGTGVMLSKDHAELDVLLRLWNEGLLRDLLEAHHIDPPTEAQLRIVVIDGRHVLPGEL